MDDRDLAGLSNLQYAFASQPHSAGFRRSANGYGLSIAGRGSPHS